MKLFKEFKDFAVKGNMIDMAIGIIIGASFNAVINVLVKNIILPPLSLLSDGINFQETYFKIGYRNYQSSVYGLWLICRNRSRFSNRWIHHFYCRKIHQQSESKSR